MFRLRIGYLIVGITTGLAVLFGFFLSLPDGKLHIVFCDVGQGDAAYIRFPDGRDMLVDGGPNNRVLECLGRHMPFWDRHINLVLLTHPQKDHLQGLITVFDRYTTDYFVRSDIANTTDGYKALMDVIDRRKIKQRLVTTGETVQVGSTTLSVLWPSSDQIARMKPQPSSLGQLGQLDQLGTSVLGSSTIDLNDGSVVFALRYGSFDALFPGDADTHVESQWRDAALSSFTTHLSSPRTRGSSEKQSTLALDQLEVLKYPHHGSKTAMTPEFLARLFPHRPASRPGLEAGLAIISVGKNSYGHPSEAALATLAKQAVQVKRTDKEGDIEVVSDGMEWEIH